VTLVEHETEVYCKPCYNKKWGPKGVRGGAQGGMMHAADLPEKGEE